jgi:DNA primase
MIPQSFIDELLNRLDIVDVVERYLPLKKAGANYQACCPFHNEKTPSFTVSPTKQFYHCFGCGAHGTAIGFVMEQAGLDFVEAIKELASSAGMTVPEEKFDAASRQSQTKTQDLTDLLQRASQYYRAELKRSDIAIDYLKKRGLTGEIAARFGIGYAPADWQNLAATFPDYQTKSLVEAGLVIEGENGKRYDRFRDRIMFPIQNQRGHIIGFGGRVLDKGEPKYLNSPEMPVFEKGRELYGLPQARQSIRKVGKVLVVEGYMDVVALAQHGVEYAVATLGTATTPLHVQKLLRQSDDVVFCFDGDTAGRKAAWRALENALPQVADGKRLSFLFLPQGEDPDSYVRAAGKEGFEKQVAQALPLSEFMLRELAARSDMQTQEGRSSFLLLAKPLFTQIHAQALGLMLRKRLAEMAGISQAELEALYQIKPVARSRAPRAKQERRPLTSPAKMLLRCVLNQPALGESFSSELLVDGNTDGAVLAAVLEFIRSHPQIKGTAQIVQHFVGGQYESELQLAAGEILGWGEDYDIQADFDGAIAALREQHGKRTTRALDQKSLTEMSPEEKQQYLAAVSYKKLDVLRQKADDLDNGTKS